MGQPPPCLLVPSPPLYPLEMVPLLSTHTHSHAWGWLVGPAGEAVPSTCVWELNSASISLQTSRWSGEGESFQLHLSMGGSHA